MNTLATVLILLTSLLLITDSRAEPITTAPVIASPVTTSAHPVLKIELDNLNEKFRHHNIYIAIYPAAGHWSDEPLFKTQVANAALFPLQITDLAAGYYALRLFVDTNENGQLDLNTQGLPIEPFGFSSKIKLRRMPTLSEAVFELVHDTQQTIKVYQPRLKKTTAS
jgi:uncharacterized protein (DUF2141 family)